ncbi:MAG: DNA repair protein RecN [Elusimicrobia bacterium]|nr:DNA repair protein RecN [Elusimicrobiota bacterium]
MLKSLSIRDFAVVSELDLELGPGLNVFTGETGAGKSILIEALGFLLGARASTTWLRQGAARLRVEGVFAAGARAVTLRRELDASGKSRSAVDGRPATTAELAAFGRDLVDFHGQHEHQTLLRPGAQLDALDAFAGLGEQRARTAELHRGWTQAAGQLEAARMSDAERAKRVELARLQVEELDAARLRPGEEAELEAELPLLKNSDRVRGLAESAYGLLYAGEGAALGALQKALRSLEELARFDPALGSACEGLRGAAAAVEEAARGAGALRERMEADPARLDALQQRLEALARLKRRYGATVAELVDKRARLAEELDCLENSEQRLAELERRQTVARDALQSACARLHKQRTAAAGKLSAALLGELRELGMPNARLDVSVESDDENPGPGGCDSVELLLAPNPGEPLKPLRAIASGGELSRVMLALKTVFAGAGGASILVFDEVDAGVGGAVARCVGRRLADLSRRHQILCVTHLAQVACFAPVHLHVSKAVRAGRTLVRVERLEGEGRLEAVARLLGGRALTEASRRHAQELLESSRI